MGCVVVAVGFPFLGVGFALLSVGFAVVMDTDCRLYVGIGLGWWF